MSNIDYTKATELLEKTFSEATVGFSKSVYSVLTRYKEAFDIVFESKTQSYREVLLGCALAHIVNPEVNVRLPYMKQGDGAFNGRTLDEKVINPFLVSKQIPCSKGPYLATFRRNVKLDASARDGLRDQKGYDAMLEILDAIELSQETRARDLLLCLLYKFMELREKSTIRLISVERLSVEQYRNFVDTLLHNHSGGLIPVLIAEALLDTINTKYNCEWDISRQGINAADGATGAAGDITIAKNGRTVKAIEVTERPIDRARVTTTFNTKISTNSVQEYLFIYTTVVPEDEAYRAAESYFAQGYDINFIRLTNLVISEFVIGDAETRKIFMEKMLLLLRQTDIPAAVKTAWNDALQATISV